MKLGLVAALCSLTSFTIQANTLSFDQKTDQLLQPVADLFTRIIFYSIDIAGRQFPLIVGWLILAAFIFTFYFL